MLRYSEPEPELIFSSLWAALCAAGGGALLPQVRSEGRLRAQSCARQSLILLKGAVGDSHQRLGAPVHAAEQHLLLLLSLNIRFVMLMVPSKEAEPQAAAGQELCEASPRAGAGTHTLPGSPGHGVRTKPML